MRSLVVICLPQKAFNKSYSKVVGRTSSCRIGESRARVRLERRELLGIVRDNCAWFRGLDERESLAMMQRTERVGLLEGMMDRLDDATKLATGEFARDEIVAPELSNKELITA